MGDEPYLSVTDLFDDSSFNKFDRTKSYVAEIERRLQEITNHISPPRRFKGSDLSIELYKTPSKNEVCLTVRNSYFKASMLFNISVEEEDDISINGEYHFTAEDHPRRIAIQMPSKVPSLQEAMKAILSALVSDHQYSLSWTTGVFKVKNHTQAYSRSGLFSKDQLHSALHKMGAFEKQQIEVEENPPPPIKVKKLNRDFRDLE